MAETEKVSTEKVSMNMSVVDLGQIDLLVDQGFYSSRTDFLRTAVRNLLTVHAPTVQQAVARHFTGGLGVWAYSRQYLEQIRAAGEQIEIKVVGLAIIENDVSAELARAAIGAIKVFGSLRASEEVRKALADRIS